MLRVVPNMARHVSTALAVLSGSLALLTFASPGHAQLVISITNVQGRDLAARPLSAIPLGFNKVECDGAATVDLTISNIPLDAPYLDFWSGEGCDTVAARTATPTHVCKHLIAPSDFTPGTAVLNAGQVTVPDLGGCTASANGDVAKIYVLAATAVGPDGSSEEIDVSHYGTFSVSFDVVAPDPPTAVRGGSGSTAVPVSWTRTTGTVNGYRVYVGSSSSAEGGACGGGTLVAGAAPPASATLATTATSTAGSANLNLASLGLAIGESVEVGVTARDVALNEGVLSNITCVTRVETCGYLCQRGGTISTCSAVPGARRAGGAVGASLLVAALSGLLIRARRGRSAR